MADIIEVDAVEKEIDDTYEVATLLSNAMVEGDEYRFPVLWTMADQIDSYLIGRGSTPDLEATEETIAETKKFAAEINRNKREFETDRTAFKSAEAKKHNDFLAQAQQTVLKVWDKHSVQVATAVKKFEEEKKEKVAKTGEVYWEELSEVEGLEFIPYDKLSTKVGVNTKEAELRKQIDEAIVPYKRDLELIALQSEPERVLEKYKLNLDITESLMEIKDEDRIYEEMKRKEEEKKAAETVTKEAVAAPEEPAPIEAPKEVKSDEVEATPVATIIVELKGNPVTINWLLNQAEENGIEVVSAERKASGQAKFF